MDKLMFFIALRQKLANAAMRIVSINDLRKKLSPIYNLNISNLRVHLQVIITILQKIVTLIKDCLILHQAPNKPTLSALSRPSINKAPNQFILLAPNQPTLSAAPRLLIYDAPNQLIPSAPSGQPSHEVPNQPTPSTLNKPISSAPSRPPTHEVPN